MIWRYQADVEAAAAAHKLDAALVRAVCMVESSGRTSAYRFEPAFWTRYLADNSAYRDGVPERVSASYGLMQVMHPVACELGYTGEPEALCVPSVGLDYGCRKLAQVLAWARGDVAAGLAAYNGGMTRDNAPGRYPKRNQLYVDKVKKALSAAGVKPTFL